MTSVVKLLVNPAAVDRPTRGVTPANPATPAGPVSGSGRRVVEVTGVPGDATLGDVLARFRAAAAPVRSERPKVLALALRGVPYADLTPGAGLRV